jgi:hypothetical protein
MNAPASSWANPTLSPPAAMADRAAPTKQTSAAMRITALGEGGALPDSRKDSFVVSSLSVLSVHQKRCFSALVPLV